MKIVRTVLAGLAAALIASSAQAGKLEIVYWGPGMLEWVKIDGYSYTVEEDTIEVNNVPAGSYYLEFGANGTTRSLTLRLDSSNYAKSGDWCVELLLESHSLLDDEDCEWMWDEYYYGW